MVHRGASEGGDQPYRVTADLSCLQKLSCLQELRLQFPLFGPADPNRQPIRLSTLPHMALREVTLNGTIAVDDFSLWAAESRVGGLEVLRVGSQ